MSTLVFDKEIRREIAALRLHIRRVFAGEGGGAVHARGAGAGHDFHDHRAYAHGDDFRHLDWNLFLRHGDLFVKRFRQETDVEFLIIVDRSCSMTAGQPSKDVFTLRLACALGACLSGPAQHVEIRSAEAGLPAIGPRIRGDSDLEAVMNTIESLPAPTGKMLLDLAQAQARHARNRVVIFIGDLLDGTDALHQLGALRSDRCELLAALVSTAEERAPAYDGRVRLDDLEGEGSLRFEVDGALRAAYVRLFDEHLSECERAAAALGIRLRLLDTAEPLDHAVLSLARKGALIR